MPQGAVSSWGPEAIDLAAGIGITLDPGQGDLLTDGMSERADGRWLTPTVVDNEPRQNGKGVILEVRALAGVLLVKEPLIVWTAHEFKTANQGFLRMKEHVTNWDHVRKRVRAIRSSTHATEIEFQNPTRRIAFLARSGGSGRGFAGVAPLFLDEAFAITPEQLAALQFATSAHPNPQAWWMSSAPLPDSDVFREVCLRGRRGSRAMTYYEWSSSGKPVELGKLVAANKALTDAELDTADGREVREQLLVKVTEANRSFGRPGGVGVSETSIESELETVGVEQWLRERLGIFLEDPDEAGWLVIPKAAWEAALVPPDSQIVGRPAFGVKTSLSRSYTAIVAAGARAGGGRQIELTVNGADVVDFRPGTAWVVSRLKELEKHDPSVLVIDDKVIADAAEEAGLVVHRAVASDVASGFALMFDGIAGGDLAGRDVHHLGQQELTEAVKGGGERKIGQSGRAWAQIDPAVEVVTADAASLALFGHSTPRVHRELAQPFFGSWR